MDNVVIYARFSSHGQTEQSIEGQLKECHLYAQRNNYNVVGEYIDRALTGTNDRRPEFQRMIEDSKKKLFNYVLVYQLDRFARDRYDSAVYKHKLKKNDVRVISVKENISADASGIVFEAVLEGIAEYYSAELSQKVRRGKSISAEKCKHLGGKCPFGYKVGADMQYEIDEESAKWVLKAFEMYADGTPARHIMYMFNDNKVPNTFGRAWTKNSIHNMLKHKRYNGYYVYNGTEVKGGMPKIVPDDVFEKVQERIRKNMDAPARGRAKVPYILTTKLFCGKCERSMVGVSGTSKQGVAHHYYKCLGNVLHEGCDVKAVQKDYLEDKVITHVKKALTDNVILHVAKLTHDVLAKEKGHDNVTSLRKQLEKNKTAINNLLNTLALGKSTDLILGKIEELQAEQARIEYNIAKEQSFLFKLSVEEIANILREIRDTKTNTIEEKQRFIDTFVYKIYYYEDKKVAVLININGTTDTSDISLQDVSDNEKGPMQNHAGSHKSNVAESEGFEPPWACTQTVFKTASL